MLENYFHNLKTRKEEKFAAVREDLHEGFPLL